MQNYRNRMMQANDPRFAKIAERLYGRRDLVAETPKRDPLDHDGDGRRGGSPKQEASDALTAARAKYQEVVGKRPFHGWSVEEIGAKITEAQS